MPVEFTEVLEDRPKNISLLNLSVSKAKSFKDCQAKFRFSYIERLPQKERDYHIFGKFLHEVLEKFHKELIAGCTDPYNIIISRSFKSAYQNFKNKLNEDQIKECKNIIKKYLIKLDTDKKIGRIAQVLDVEKQFYININNKILLNGFIDRVQLDADGILHVGDYKTTLLIDKKNPDGVFSESEKYKRYKKDLFQLRTYAYVMCLEDPTLQKVRCSYIMLRHDFHLIEKVFSRNEIMEMGDIFLDYAQKIEEEKLYRPNLTPLCEYCDFAEKDICTPGFDYVKSRNEEKNAGKSFGETDW